VPLSSQGHAVAAHLEYQALSARIAAAIAVDSLLRLADNLARNPDQEAVELTGCEIQPARVVLKLKSSREAGPGEWAASRVSDAFEEVYGRTVVVTHERA